MLGKLSNQLRSEFHCEIMNAPRSRPTTPWLAWLVVLALLVGCTGKSNAPSDVPECQELANYDAKYTKLSTAELERAYLDRAAGMPSARAQMLAMIKGNLSAYAEDKRPCMYRVILVTAVAQAASVGTAMPGMWGLTKPSAELKELFLTAELRQDWTRAQRQEVLDRIEKDFLPHGATSEADRDYMRQQYYGRLILCDATDATLRKLQAPQLADCEGDRRIIPLSQLRATHESDEPGDVKVPPIFLTQADLPPTMRITQDSPSLAPKPEDTEWTKQRGRASGLVQWTDEPSEPIMRVVDIRWVFPTPEQAQAYHAARLLASAEGATEIPNSPNVGSDSHLFGGLVEVPIPPDAAAGAKAVTLSMTQYYYLFRVDNVVVKLFLAAGPKPKSPLTVAVAKALAEKAVLRIKQGMRAWK